MDAIQLGLLEQVADLHGVPEGAYNIRSNGQGIARNSTANIEIAPKQDKPGIDIIIKPGTKKESVHIPVVLSQSGLKDMVYNDFYVGEDADVVIVQAAASTMTAVRIPSTTVFTAFSSERMPG